MRKRMAIIGLAIALITLITPLVSQACGGGGGPITVTAPVTRLAIGRTAVVATEWNDTLNLRDTPEIYGRIEAGLTQGMKVTVIDGPTQSKFGYMYWKIVTEDKKLTGWVAEGADGTYWVNPVN